MWHTCYTCSTGGRVKLSPKVAEELSMETNRMLEYDCPLKPNISKEEVRTLKELKRTSPCHTHNEKGSCIGGTLQAGLNQQSTLPICSKEHLQTINSRPTKKHKFINLLRTIMA